ncbi:EAL domain-containing protein [Desulfohalovibrio reitneri]|uniref:EAL domain-containing protein n=1 Tax=Desulfohalovibrio reitneri TaxID=1307759 RepID=UPI0004A72DD0|nr:EAL domain-containing protein [Desulfohalovibrio reitneri]
MHSCSRCETLPDPLPGKGTLYLVPPISPTGADIRSYVTSLGLDLSEPYDNVYAVPVTSKDLSELCSSYLCRLSLAETRDTKSLLLAEGEELTPAGLASMEPLSVLVNRIQGEWLLDILKAERLTTWFQPIVHCSEPSRPFAHECLLRGLNAKGEPVPPGEMFDIARHADLLFYLDRAARISSVRNAATAGLEGKVFINFLPTSIYNPEYCLKTTLAAIEEAGLSPEQIVFEVVESEEVDDTDHLLDVLRYYRENGFQVALDDLGAGYGSLNLLSRLKPDYMKMDLQLIRNVDRDEFKAAICANMLKLADQVGVTSIAEGVETEGEWRWLCQHGAHLAQGFLFARPGNPPQAPVVPAG